MPAWLRISSLCSCVHVRNSSLTAMTHSETLKKKKTTTPSFLALFHFLFPCNVLWCSSSLDLVKRSSGVAWQQPSVALSLQSPRSAVRLPPECCQVFLFFLHGSTLPSALPIFVHLFQHFFLISSSAMLINRLFPTAHRMSNRLPRLLH